MQNFHFQLKQFQKSGKGSPKHRDSKGSKKNAGAQDHSAHHKDTSNSDTNISHSDITDTTNTSLRDITNTTNTPQSDITDRTQTILEPTVEAEVTGVAGTDIDNTYTDQTVPDNQALEDTGRETEYHSVQDNNPVEKTDNYHTEQTVFPQVCDLLCTPEPHINSNLLGYMYIFLYCQYMNIV